jgi:hypothetical protein
VAVDEGDPDREVLTAAGAGELTDDGQPAEPAAEHADVLRRPGLTRLGRTVHCGLHARPYPPLRRLGRAPRLLTGALAGSTSEPTEVLRRARTVHGMIRTVRPFERPTEPSAGAVEST